MAQAGSRTSDRLHALFANQDLIARMCRVGARATVMRDLLPDDISTRSLYDLFRQFTGESPKQGPLPNGLGTLLRTPHYRLQASVAICKYEQIAEAEPDYAGRYVAAFEAYQRTFGESAVFDFNRVWFLLRQYKIGRCRLAKCSKCSCSYVYQTEDVSDRYKCPVCWFHQRATASTGALRSVGGKKADELATGARRAKGRQAAFPMPV